jgi:uncharacterized membrane protein/thiol-disulfide isomerase/thioredoxin
LQGLTHVARFTPPINPDGHINPKSEHFMQQKSCQTISLTATMSSLFTLAFALTVFSPASLPSILRSKHHNQASTLFNQVAFRLPGQLQTVLDIQSEQPVVKGIMFWMESCGHCHYVLSEVLPPLQSLYREQLEINLIEAKSAEDFDRLYQIASLYGIDKNDVGVPFLVIGDQVLIGPDQISTELPDLIDYYLAKGGVGVPDILQDTIPTPMPDKVIIYLFWGDGCPHCAVAKPALHALAQSNQNIEIRDYEVWYQEENQAAFISMSAAFGFEPHYVPTIFIGERYWEGYSENIQKDIEATIAICLETGCPDAGNGIITTDPPAIIAQSASAETEAPRNNVQIESNGYVLAIIVLVVMAASLIYSSVYMMFGQTQRQNVKPIRRRKTDSPVRPEAWRNRGFLALSLVGLIVAGYLAYIETQAVLAVCGPIGDCNAVQSSPYARLFGVLPVGVLGVIGYLAILAAWMYPRLRHDQLASYMPVIVFGVTFSGVLFSLYLTYLEPFVIKAVCIWCITSSVIMTLLLLLSLKPALQALQFLQETDPSHGGTEIETQ